MFYVALIKEPGSLPVIVERFEFKSNADMYACALQSEKQTPYIVLEEQIRSDEVAIVNPIIYGSMPNEQESLEEYMAQYDQYNCDKTIKIIEVLVLYEDLKEDFAKICIITNRKIDAGGGCIEPYSFSKTIPVDEVNTYLDLKGKEFTMKELDELKVK